MSKILLCPICTKRKPVRADAEVCSSGCRVKKSRKGIAMNDYLHGTIDTCIALAKNKTQFVANIKKATGYTDKGIKGNKYIQGIISTWDQ